MENNEETIVSVDQLPDDHMKMPPPYWRGSGALFHILSALYDLNALLNELIPIHTVVMDELAVYRKKPSGRQERADLTKIAAPLLDLEHRVRLKSELACLMSAIQAEDILNMFCVFNLHRNIAESIEKLQPQEKLLIASSVVGHYDVKGTRPYESMQKLVKWRNAFAHGHCVDRPMASLRHNHLIYPPECPGVKSALRDAVGMVETFLHVQSYLCSISLNRYTAGGSLQFDEMEELARKLSRYRVDGNERAYRITLDKEQG